MYCLRLNSSWQLGAVMIANESPEYVCIICVSTHSHVSAGPCSCKRPRSVPLCKDQWLAVDNLTGYTSMKMSLKQIAPS